MRTKYMARAAASAAVLALALTACNDPAGAPVPPAKPSAPSTQQGMGSSAGASGGAADTGSKDDAPAAEGFGKTLAMNEPATATYKDDDGPTQLEIKPTKVEKGSWDDFKGFDLKDTDTKNLVPYYLVMSYTSKGGAEPWITTWDAKRDALVAPDQEVGRLTMLDDFKKCPNVDPDHKPGQFKKGMTENACKVYMVPKNKPLYVRWGVGGTGEDVKPIVWKVLD
ncbi:hypothetical protein [Streptomyces sirii]|uniref:hypothetical protein n=1 Tax=Streptomyces sirii TaxID=3127701 RepID=UPI003D35E15E